MTDTEASPTTRLLAACKQYETAYFGRSLNSDEFAEALQLMLSARTQSILVLREWQAEIDGSGIYQNKQLDVISEILRRGSNAFRMVRVAQAYSKHLASQTEEADDETWVDSAVRQTVRQVSVGIDVVADGLETIVAAIQAHLTVLLMSSQVDLMAAQNTLNERIRKLTRWTTILTVVILVITAFGAIVTGLQYL